MSDIRAVADFRGTFIQSTLATLFLRITDVDGTPVDPTSITIAINDPNNNPIVLTDSNGNIKPSDSAEKISDGFYFFDWGILLTAMPGQYTVTWSYTTDSMVYTVLQQVIVAEATYPDPQALYSGKVFEFRQMLGDMLPIAQYVPVNSEPFRKNIANQTYSWTFPRWNQGSHCQIYINDIPVDSGATINYSKGTVTFDQPLTQYDRLYADYNFRWWRDDELDAFLSNGIARYNNTPPFTNQGWNNLPLNWAGTVLDMACSYAIRNLMLRLLTAEARLVFNDPQLFGNLETLKKNYEEQAKEALDNKKLGSYRGLTRMITIPEYTLPGGRSRWFRSLFSGGSA